MLRSPPREQMRALLASAADRRLQSQQRQQHGDQPGLHLWQSCDSRGPGTGSGPLSNARAAAGGRGVGAACNPRAGAAAADHHSSVASDAMSITDDWL
jgi:hypothetical protein